MEGIATPGTDMSYGEYPAGNLAAELEQLLAVEKVAGAVDKVLGGTNSTEVCSGGWCCV